jgi:hypothetical protein
MLADLREEMNSDSHSRNHISMREWLNQAGS